MRRDSEAELLAAETIIRLPAQVDLSVYQGDDLFLTITVDTTVTTIDLTGYTVESQVRTKPGVDPVVATFTATVLSADTLQLHLPSVEATKLPATSVWDVQIIDSAGVVTTLAYGTVTAMREVTT